MSDEPPQAAPTEQLVDEAWRILCNVSEGDWTKQSPEWQQAVERFREKYHADLNARTGLT